MIKVDVLVGGSGKWSAFAQDGTRPCDRNSTLLANGHIPRNAPWDEVFLRQFQRSAANDEEPRSHLRGGRIIEAEVPDWAYESLLESSKERSREKRFYVKFVPRFRDVVPIQGVEVKATNEWEAQREAKYHLATVGKKDTEYNLKIEQT